MLSAEHSLPKFDWLNEKCSFMEKNETVELVLNSDVEKHFGYLLNKVLRLYVSAKQLFLTIALEMPR